MPFSYDYASMLVPDSFITACLEILAPEINTVKKLEPNYNTAYASLYAPNDVQMLTMVEEIIEQKKRLNPQACIVIGIGGSNLGTRALQEAVLGTMYLLRPEHTKIFYVDTVDSDSVYDTLLLVEQLFIEKHAVILNVVSKSGTTTETIANVELFIALFKRYLGDEYHHYVVATTDRDSGLWQLGLKERYSLLEIPRLVGGRYSVFSSVGLFPLGIIGIDIRSLIHGAREMVDRCAQLHDNPAALRAITHYYWYKKNWRLHDTFIFSSDLASMGAWYRQLVGESLGKEYDKHGNKIEAGIIPLISMGSTDLHSVGQLYLSGHYGIYTTFIAVKQTKSLCQLPDYPAFNALVPHIQRKTLPALMQAILTGVQTAYQKREKPFAVLQLSDKSPATLGGLMQCMMLEVIYLAYLLDINPFDQPNVEMYKQETRRILAHE